MTLRLAHVSADPEAERRQAEDRLEVAVREMTAALLAVARASAAPEPARPVELLSVTQAAERLGGLSRSTLYQCLTAGTVQSVRIGGRRLIPSTEVERLASGTVARNVTSATVTGRRARRVTGAAAS